MSSTSVNRSKTLCVGSLDVFGEQKSNLGSGWEPCVVVLEGTALEEGSLLLRLLFDIVGFVVEKEFVMVRKLCVWRRVQNCELRVLSALKGPVRPSLAPQLSESDPLSSWNGATIMKKTKVIAVPLAIIVGKV